MYVDNELCNDICYLVHVHHLKKLYVQSDKFEWIHISMEAVIKQVKSIKP